MTKIEVMQCLLGASKTKENICISYRNENNEMEKLSGIVDSFNGVIVKIEGKEIAFQMIDDIELQVAETIPADKSDIEDKITQYIGQRVGLTVWTGNAGKSVDGIVFAIENGEVQFVTDEGLSMFPIADVRNIKAYGEENVETVSVEVETAETTSEETEIKEVSKEIEVNEEWPELNSFETALVNGMKSQVEEFIDNSGRLLELGYTSEDITRMVNVRDIINWDDTNYGIACRLNSLQLNKDGLAEFFFEKALNEVDESKKKTKILNTLATIYVRDSGEKYISFYEKYRDRLEKNSNYCIGYADNLKKLGRWEELDAFIPICEKKNPEMVQRLAEFKSYVSFKQNVQDINIETLKEDLEDILNENVSKEELVSGLTDGKEAYQKLLHEYSKQGSYKSYFAVAEAFLFDAVLHGSIMTVMRKMLLKCADASYINHFLPKLPALWCDEELIGRFECADEDTPEEIAAYLQKQKQFVMEYPALNVVETSIANADYETLRNIIADADMLLQLGYTEEEIYHLQQMDLEKYIKLDEKICTAVRMLDFQKNKNHVAERYLFDGIYRDTSGIANKLCPLLLQENRDTFVMSLHEFGPMVGRKKEKAERYGISPLETAILEVDTVKMREYINQPDKLASFGYTPDEIRRLQDILDKPYGKGMNNIDIARRFDIFQKNKNRLTETYYLLALEEEPIQAANGLFRIYSEEENWNNVCKMYEQYLASEYEGKHNLFYDKLYGIALFELKQYRKLYEQWKTYYYLDEKYPLYQQLMLGMELLGITEDADKVAELALKDNVKADIAYNMILTMLQNKKLSDVHTLVCRLYNVAFQSFNIQQLQALAPMFAAEEVSALESPIGNGIICLATENNEILPAWYDYLMAGKAQYERITFIGKLAMVYSGSAEQFTEEMMRIYEEVIQNGGSGNLYNTLINVLDKILQNETEKNAWLERTKERETVDYRTLNLCWKYCEELGKAEEMALYIQKACKEIGSDCARENIIRISMEVCEQLSEKEKVHELNAILECIEQIWTKQQMSLQNNISIYHIYAQTGRMDKAFMMEQAIRFMLLWESSDSEELISEFESLVEKYKEQYENNSLFDVLKAELEKSDISSIERFCEYWCNYLKLDSHDKECLHEMQNNTESAEVWEQDYLDALAKAIISMEEQEKYWSLLKKVYTEPSLQAASNIAYHRAIYAEMSIEQEMLNAMDNDLPETTFYIILQNMRGRTAEQIISSQKMLGRIKTEKPEWFALDAVQRMLPEIFYNMQATLQLSTEAQAWNTVHASVEVALYTGYIEAFIDEFENYLTNVDAKHCGYLLCKLLLQDSDVALLKRLATCLENNHREAPYTKLALDLYKKYCETSLDETDKLLLRYAISGKANLVGVSGMLNFYYETVFAGMTKQALEATLILQKYFPEDALVYELEYFYRDTIRKDSDDAIERLYFSIFKYMGMITETSYYDILARRLIYGERYLEWIGRTVPEDKSIIAQVKYRSDLSYVRTNHTFLYSIYKELNETPDKEFLPCIYKAFFTREWSGLFKYIPVEGTIESLLERLHFYGMMLGREVEFVKSAVTHILFESPTDESEACIRALWEYKPIFGMSYAVFRNVVSEWTEEQKQVVCKLWKISFENKDIAGKGLFGTILQENVDYEFVIPVLKTISPRARKNLFIEKKEKQIAEEFVETAKEEVVEVEASKAQNVETESTIAQGALASLEKNKEYYVNLLKKYELKDRSLEEMAKLEFREKAVVMRAAAVYFNICVALNHAVDESIFTFVGPEDFINAITQSVVSKTRCKNMITFIQRMGKKYHLAGRCIILTLCGNDAENIGMLEQASNEADYIEDDKLRNAVYYAIYVLTRAKYSSISDRVYNKTLYDLEYPILSSYNMSSAIHQIDTSCFQNDGMLHKKQRAIVSTRKETTSTAEIMSCYFIQEALHKFKDLTITTYTRLPRNIANYTFEDAEKEYICRIAYFNNNLDFLTDFEAEQCRKLCIELGLLYLKHEESIDVRILTEVLSMISDGYYLEGVLLEDLIQAIRKYYLSFDNLDSLCVAFRQNKYMLERVAYLRNPKLDEWGNVNVRYICDLQDIIGTLEESLSLQDGEALKVSVDKCMKQLQRKKNLQSVEKVRIHLIHLVTNKNVLIQSVPKLKIYFDDDETGEEQVWLSEKEEGQLSGYIQNIGGIEALDVKVECIVNGVRETVFIIDKVFVNERLPFAVPFDEEDLIDDKVSWTVNVIYFDQDGHEKSQLKKRSVKVRFDEGELDYGSMITNEIISGEEFVGRQTELRTMKSMMNIRPDSIDDLTSICVKGLRRMGKSSIVKQLIETELTKHSDKLFVVDVSGQEIHNDVSKPFIVLVLDKVRNYLYEDKMVELIKAGKDEEAGQLINGEFAAFNQTWTAKAEDGTWVAGLSQFYKELSKKYLDGKHILLALDEMEKIFFENHFASVEEQNAFFDMFRTVTQRKEDPISFIVIGSDKFLSTSLMENQNNVTQVFQNLGSVYISRMKKADIEEVYRKYSENSDITFSPEAIERIWEYTNGLVWYAKLLGKKVTTTILTEEMTLRTRVTLMDIQQSLELFLEREKDSYSLLMQNLDIRQKSILRAMVLAMPERNEVVNVSRIKVNLEEVRQMGYMDTSGAELVYMNEEELIEQLDFLDEMGFVEKVKGGKQYKFAAELYRIFIQKEKVVRKLQELEN